MLHYNALVYCMQYLKGTKNKWLLFRHRNHDNITGYMDTDRIMQENNKAISGYAGRIFIRRASPSMFSFILLTTYLGTA